MSGRILLVEDETLIALDVQRQLRRLGYEVNGVCASGREALDRVCASRPDLVLMDIRLEGDLDGIQTAELLNHQYDLPVIYLTSYADPETLERAKLTAPYGYIQKPTNPHQLHSALLMAQSRHLIERRLRESEEKLGRILDALLDPVLLWNTDQICIWANAAARSLFRRDPLQRSVTELLPQGRELAGLIAECVACRSALEREMPIELPGGRTPEFWCTAQVVQTGPVGQAELVATTLRDITEKKALRAEAARTAHLASLGELAAGVAHEINNPIGGIINFAERLQDRGEALGSDAELPARIIRESERIAGIVRKLLTFARVQIEEPGPVDLVEVIKDALSLSRAHMEREGILVDVAVQEDLPHVHAKGQELQQVFVNLISNARYALNERFPDRHPDKRLTISLERWTAEDHDQVRVVVEDAGAGFPETLRERIFDPFFSTKPKNEGTGLGLSISHAIVQDHGGRLDLESRPGCTRAVVLLPQKEPAQ